MADPRRAGTFHDLVRRARWNVGLAWGGIRTIPSASFLVAADEHSATSHSAARHLPWQFSRARRRAEFAQSVEAGKAMTLVEIVVTALLLLCIIGSAGMALLP